MKTRRMTRTRAGARQKPAYDQFNATHLYCPRCGQAMPVRPRLLLVLPEGDKYNYHCAGCGDVLGAKIDRGVPGMPRLA